MQEELTSTPNSQTMPENTSPNGKGIPDPKTPQERSEKILNFLSKFKQSLQLNATGTIKYANNSLGASLAFSFALFNSITTINGAAKVLPLWTGVPIGALISVAYFIILTSTRVKAQHPLRRLLLILILAPASAYTSFFSIYDQMIEGRLEQQSFKEIVRSHNKLVTDIDGYLKQVISQSEKSLGGKIAQIDKLDKQINDLTQKRNERGLNQDIRGNYAANIQKQENEKKLLEDEIKKLPAYTIYGQITKIREKYADRLNELLEEKKLMSSGKQPEEVFQNDNKLYFDIKADIDGFLDMILKQNFTPIRDFESSRPLENNYVRTPIFLVPLNSLSNSGKEAKFIWIALIIAIGMEVIPILLSGIHVTSDPEFYANEKKSNTYNQKKSFPATTEKKYPSQIYPKTVITQISELLNSSILNLKQLYKEIYNAFTQHVSTPALYNMRDDVSRRLQKAMHAAKLETQEDRHEFLINFYAIIDHDLKEIDLKPKQHSLIDPKEKEKEKKFELACKLFVDVMHSKKVNLLGRFPQWERIHRGASNLSINSVQTTITQLVDEIKEVDKPPKNIIAGKWYFNEQAYEKFLDWWLEAHHLKEVYTPQEIIEAKMSLLLLSRFLMNSSLQNSDTESYNPNDSIKSE